MQMQETFGTQKGTSAFRFSTTICIVAGNDNKKNFSVRM
jgi:hypothetical protein